MKRDFLTNSINHSLALLSSQDPSDNKVTQTQNYLKSILSSFDEHTKAKRRCYYLNQKIKCSKQLNELQQKELNELNLKFPQQDKSQAIQLA